MTTKVTTTMISVTAAITSKKRRILAARNNLSPADEHGIHGCRPVPDGQRHVPGKPQILSVPEEAAADEQEELSRPGCRCGPPPCRRPRLAHAALTLASESPPKRPGGALPASPA